jgi:hypothetical protein
LSRLEIPWCTFLPLLCWRVCFFAGNATSHSQKNCIPL